MAGHNTRKMLIEEFLNRTRLEILLRNSYGNYCVQVWRSSVLTTILLLTYNKTALDYAEPGQRALLVDGIRPVLPLIRNTPYGKRIQNKLQREQQNLDHFDGFHGQQTLAADVVNHDPFLGDPLAGGADSAQTMLYSTGGPSQGQAALSRAGLRGPAHGFQSHAFDTASSASNAGPRTPPISLTDTRQIQRAGGRAWDPARGVEIFKRGSEEVLTRFLKMGTREEEKQSQSPT